MKTSNKILIGLLAIIFLTINAAIIEIKVFGVHRSERKIVKQVENFPLQTFSNILIEDKRNTNVHLPITIKSSNNNLIRLEVFADTLIVGFKHTIINDTLKIESLIDKPFMHSITLESNGNIESISVEGIDIRISGISQDSISLLVKNGEINSWGNDSLETSNFKKLIVKQDNARVNMHNVSVDTVDIEMIKSNAIFTKNIKVVNADVKDYSKLQLRNVKHVNFEKDDASKVYFH